MNLAYLVTTVVLLLAPAALAESHELQDSCYNPIYLDDFEGLFDQSSVTDSEQYKNASSEVQEKLLAEYFLAAKFKRVVSSARWAMGTLASTGAGALGTYTLMAKNYISKPKLPNIDPIIFASSSLSAVFGGAIFLYSPIKAFFDWVTREVSSLTLSFYQYFSGTTADSLEKYEVAYIKRKPKLDPGFQDAIEEAIFDARTEEPRRLGTSEATKLAPPLIKSALALPTLVKDTNYDRDAIDKLFHCYSPETVTELRRLIVRHVAGNSGQIGTQKYSVFFKGPPGTGKSRAAKLVAQTLGVPFEEISLNDVTKESFVGSRKADTFGPGLVADAMIRAAKEDGAKNFVLSIEEADRTLNADESSKLKGLPNYMLLFLDPSKPSYFNEFFKTHVSTADITIILSGNYEIKDEALNNRLHVINFDKITTECKREIVWNQFFPEVFGRYQHSKFKLNPEEFTQKDRNAFEQTILNDKDPGMRTIYKALEHYIEDLIIDKIEHKLHQDKLRATL